MDKRFFLALFLSLIVIALSQVLFPPPKPIPSSQQSASNRDSAAEASSIASSTQRIAQPSPTTVSGSVGAPLERPEAAASLVGETTSIITAKAVYVFSNVGATPASVVLRDYKNRSKGGPVTFGSLATPLLSYQLITPTDTLDLSKLSFAASHGRTTAGDETVTYTTTAGNHNVSISYTVPRDTSASYLIRVDGR